MKKIPAKSFLYRIIGICSIISMLLVSSLPLSAYAAPAQASAATAPASAGSEASGGGAAPAEVKTVRIGMFDNPGFSEVAEDGSRSGLGYEYIQEIAYRANWQLEFVDSNWSGLMELLLNDGIDILMDVSKTKEREQTMLFSNLVQGVEGYYIYTDSEGSGKIVKSDIGSVQGARIGADDGSFTITMLESWAEENGLDIEVVKYKEDTKWEDLKAGKLDGVVAYDMSLSRKQTPAFYVGGSDYYFAVNMQRPDILEDLNAAQFELLDEHPYYNE
ncbi:MAG: transporter substrate-binding domain-containing protein [Eubacteriales bacterium]|nr:transporter substrate-binding domain-containing protein [Eubacteriales bacterium]